MMRRPVAGCAETFKRRAWTKRLRAAASPSIDY
jgi:hypothetical protein